MRMLGLVCLAAGIVSGPAWAATPTPAAPAPPPRIFVSPSGEPFRLEPSTPDPLKAWFDQVDTDHDGSIDRAEFRADALNFFKKLDENGDGVIDGFETADYENKLVPEFAEWAEGRFPGQFPPQRGDHGRGGAQDGGQRPGGGRGGHERGGERADSDQDHAQPAGGRARPQASRGIAQLLDEPEPVTGADYALDGRITQAEWIKAADQRFELLDTAKTGRLTLDQLRARLNPPKKR
jgi:hypothetical protein